METTESLQPLLFSIAYRMVGLVTEAEDLVQETFLRVHRAQRQGEDIRSLRAYSCAVVTRLAIDHLRSARATREHYVGEWLPEPIVAEPTRAPDEHAELSDSLSMAFLVLLESLSPPERAVLLLHDVFGYPLAEVAEMIDKSPANTRQIAVRARQAVAARRPRFEVSVERRWELTERFFAAVEQGDADQLVSLLADDAVMYGDGGGKAPARKSRTVGAEQVAAFVLNLSRTAVRWGARTSLMEVNGQPGAVVLDGQGRPFAVISLDIVDGQVHAIRSVMNPDKLVRVPPLG